jgi:RNase adaptor protein for sRNA GlmZ degradation
VIDLYSYGAKLNHHNLIDGIVDKIYPCHDVINPYGVGTFRRLNGRDEEIQEFIWSDPVAKRIYDNALLAVHEGARSIAFECYGGRHRSVALVELVSEKLRDLGYRVNINHLSLGVSYEAR